ncbi:hypothetical protein [Nostoc sp. DSM 114161]
MSSQFMVLRSPQRQVIIVQPSLLKMTQSFNQTTAIFLPNV